MGLFAIQAVQVQAQDCEPTAGFKWPPLTLAVICRVGTANALVL
jgi:hypothetical protein